MPHPIRIVGIDLGTTNCAVAYVDPAGGAESPVVDFATTQLLRPGQIDARPTLPSCLYVPGDHELPEGSTRLPWGEARLIAGEFARWQGARVPGRLVASAKSWLSHAGVDRSAAILPWGAPPEVAKISPVTASSLLLAHLAAAWNYSHPGAPLAEQEVVITVPASFDEVARALTVTAAQQAGLGKFTLVEEPQAAFYDFTSHHRHDLTRALQGIRLVLVVDVGGGTTDFTLIQVDTAASPLLRRIAVGDHLMLGGDNMDATLARMVEERLLTGERKLNASQWTQLVQAARDAKESLLGAGSPERHGVAIATEGSRLLGRTLSTEIKREEAERLLLEGFFPGCAPEESPRRGARMALQELGLPYAQDPAITRHLTGFLRLHARAGFAALAAAESPAATTGLLPRPDAILLNGGVFNSPRITRQLLEMVSAWWPGSPPIPLLQHESLELAVARGAAYYGLVRRGLGQRIGGGAAQALYVGLAASKTSALPQAVCLIPRGYEEGQPVDLNSQPFSLMLGRPVQFPLFATAADRVDRPGDIVEAGDEFHPLPSIHTLFKDTTGETTAVPVHLRATLTELGTLELWCVANETDERWRLEFDLRGNTSRSANTVTESMPERFAEARTLVEGIYGRKSKPGEPKEAKQLGRSLEKTLGPRENWRLPLLRELWGALLAGAPKRRRSADHERVFFQLMGYTLRPGFGYPLDEWRCEQTFKLFAEGLIFHSEQPVWNEFWVMWRRLSGGLDEARQTALWESLKPQLARLLPLAPPKTLPKLKGVQPQGLQEMVRVAASLEHLDPMEKTCLGNWITERLKNPETAAGPWAWALGRLGARVPLYGSGHKTVAAEQADEWLRLLLELDLRRIDGAPFAAAQLARLTGDRARDLALDCRTRAVAALTVAHAPEHWLRMATEVVALEASDEAQALGDTLPIGLQLH